MLDDKLFQISSLIPSPNEIRITIGSYKEVVLYTIKAYPCIHFMACVARGQRIEAIEDALLGLGACSHHVVGVCTARVDGKIIDPIRTGNSILGKIALNLLTTI